MRRKLANRVGRSARRTLSEDEAENLKTSQNSSGPNLRILESGWRCARHPFQIFFSVQRAARSALGAEKVQGAGLSSVSPVMILEIPGQMLPRSP